MCGRPCGSHVNRGMPTHVVLCQVVPWLSPLLQSGLLLHCLFSPPSILGNFPALLGLEKEMDTRRAQPLRSTSLHGPWGFTFMSAAVVLRDVVFCNWNPGWVKLHVKGHGDSFGGQTNHGCPTRGQALVACWWQVELPTLHGDTSLLFQPPEALCEDFQWQHQGHACEFLKPGSQLKLEWKRSHRQNWSTILSLMGYFGITTISLLS
jgi:hypothetical protein